MTQKIRKLNRGFIYFIIDGIEQNVKNYHSGDTVQIVSQTDNFFIIPLPKYAESISLNDSIALNIIKVMFFLVKKQ